MKKVQILLLLGLLAAALLVVLLALRNRQPPLLPPDRDHAAFINDVECLSCHGPEGESPRSKNHPVGNDCMRCHGR